MDGVQNDHRAGRPATAAFSSRETLSVALIGRLVEALQDSIGLEDAERFVSIVAADLGDRVSRDLITGNGGMTLSPLAVAQALVALKHRVGSAFRIEEVRADRIRLSATSCPFAEEAPGRPAFCRMTSGVFGRIVADNLGQARVVIEESLARGDAGCAVTILIDPALMTGDPGTSADYFRLGAHGDG